jgi:hypothetical protein
MSEVTAYIILDAARCGMDAIGRVQELCKGQQDSLYLLNEENDYLKEVAPYIFTSDEGLSEWYHEKGWGDAWGVIIVANIGFDECRKHFRKFLKVQIEGGQEQLYFRFYDPRVLKDFLPTCDQKQILEFFGPVKYFIVEGNTRDEAIRFWQENGLLKQLTVSANEIFVSKVM